MSADSKTGSRSLPEIAAVLNHSAASFWLKAAVRSALVRDPADAANDAELLSRLLARRCDEILADSKADAARSDCETTTNTTGRNSEYGEPP